MPNQINSRTDRADFTSGFSSQRLGQAERGAEAAVYSHCTMPQASCHHEPPLMSSVPVVPNFVTAGASQANIYGARAEQTRPYYYQPAPPSSLHYRPGYISKRFLFHMLRRMHSSSVIFRSRSHSFNRLFLRQLSPDFQQLRCFLLIAFSLSRGDSI